MANVGARHIFVCKCCLFPLKIVRQNIKKETAVKRKKRKQIVIQYKMALRHSGQDQHLCRRITGTSLGLVCDQHEGRCVICDGFTDLVQVARLCDECGHGREAESRCMFCGNHRAAHPAMYCRRCVMLQKDQDGCPRVMNLSRNQRAAAAKKA